MLAENVGSGYEYLRSIMEGVREPVMVIDMDYRIQDANAAFLHWTRCTPEQAIGRYCWQVTRGREEPCDSPEFSCPFRQVRETGKPVRDFHIHTDREGKKTYYNVTVLPVRDDHGQLARAIAICQDVTVQRRLEAKLAAIGFLSRELVLSRDKSWIAQTVVNAAERVLEFQLCHLWLIDEEGKALVCQAHAPAEEPPQISRLPLDGARGVTTAVARSGEAIYLPDVSKDARYVSGHPKTCSELCVPLKVGGKVIGVLNAESEKPYAFDRDDQGLFHVLADQSAMAIENARLFQTVTQQREQLSILAARLAEAEEAERQRLSQELHDQVGRNLTILGINLQLMRTQLTAQTADLLYDHLNDAQAVIEETAERVRDIMADLRPPVLDNHGIVAALRWYGKQVSLRAGMAASVQAEEPVPRLSTSVETALFRIAQEALTNAAKYARATSVMVTLEADGSIVRLTVADDGIGFDPLHLAVPESHQGWGLLNMAERARAVGGLCQVESFPGQGTRVVVEVPR